MVISIKTYFCVIKQEVLISLRLKNILHSLFKYEQDNEFFLFFGYTVSRRNITSFFCVL